MTEAAYLPASWERCKFGDIVLIRNGYAFKSADFLNEPAGPADVPLVRQSQLKGTEVDLAEAVYLPARFLEEFQNYSLGFGDIIIGMSGSIGHICSYKQHRPALQNQRTGKIELRSTDGINARFFSLYLSSVEDALIQLSKGMGVQNISSKDIENLPLNLPPLAEQQRIVAKIEELFSELDKGVESLTTAREQLKVYRQAVLKHAFEGKLTAAWRSIQTAPPESLNQVRTRLILAQQKHHRDITERWQGAIEHWKQSGSLGVKPRRVRMLESISPISSEISTALPDLPTGWSWEKLGWMTCGVDYGTSAKSSEVGAVPVIRMGNLQDGRIDWSDLVFTSDADEISQYQLAVGDVLFNRTNSPEWVGKTAIYRGERPAIFAGYLIRINHNEAVVDGNYLNYFLNSPLARQYGDTVKTDGVNQSNINGEKLQSYPFPYCSLAEQKEIVRILDEALSSTDHAISEIDSQLSRAIALRQSILQKSFSGQLVPQDPNDEPASVLLERIKAEKELSADNKQKAKKLKAQGAAV